MNIVFIDPNTESCLAAKRILEQRGHSVTFATRAEQVPGMLNPDVNVVIFDPELKGLDMAELLRQRARQGYPAPKLIAATSLERRAYGEAGYPANLAGFFQKPYSLEALADAVDGLSHAAGVSARPAAPRRIS